jgi:hypothetical protein
LRMKAIKSQFIFFFEKQIMQVLSDCGRFFFFLS